MHLETCGAYWFDDYCQRFGCQVSIRCTDPLPSPRSTTKPIKASPSAHTRGNVYLMILPTCCYFSSSVDNWPRASLAATSRTGYHGENKSTTLGPLFSCLPDLLKGSTSASYYAAYPQADAQETSTRSSKLAAFYPAIVYQVKEDERPPLAETLKKAGKRALGGGVPGAAAMGIQVLSLMWLRTTVNYQYRYGTTTTQALKTLYKDGGVTRFYRGLAPALFQGPLSRFGDTAANAGTLALLDSYDSTATLPVGVKTLAASTSAACFRIVLMPIDACKTIMQGLQAMFVALQVEGKGGFGKLTAKVRAGGPTVLFHGALAASGATFVGHYPWFFIYNTLNEMLPQYDELPKRLLRSAVIGFSASAVSDTCSNSIRVVKTSKQASTTKTTYPQVVKEIIEKEGYGGLFGRGLKTKILANGLQGLLFTVLWRIGQDMWNSKEEKK